MTVYGDMKEPLAESGKVLGLEIVEEMTQLERRDSSRICLAVSYLSS
jgi:hypothetical protein